MKEATMTPEEWEEIRRHHKDWKAGRPDPWGEPLPGPPAGRTTRQKWVTAGLVTFGVLLVISFFSSHPSGQSPANQSANVPAVTDPAVTDAPATDPPPTDPPVTDAPTTATPTDVVGEEACRHFTNDTQSLKNDEITGDEYLKRLRSTISDASTPGLVEDFRAIYEDLMNNNTAAVSPDLDKLLVLCSAVKA